MNKSLIIIGGGVAGLSAGVYGRMNGYDTKIIEQHDKPGGLCTTWKRKGYFFDGCVHWLVGSSKRLSMYRVWKDLGALKDTAVYNHKIYSSYKDKDGSICNLYTDADQLEKHLLEISPDDKKEIQWLTKAIKKISNFWNNAGDTPFSYFKNMLRIFSALPFYIKYGPKSCKDMADKFTSPVISKAISNSLIYSDFPAFAIIFTLVFMNLKSAGFPIGGSFALAQRIEKKYLSLEGEIIYRKRVKKILIDKNKAVGVELLDGSIEMADIIISAADGYATIYKMLENKYKSSPLKKLYDSQPVFKPLVQVSFGVNRDMSNELYLVRHELDSPVSVGGEQFNFLWYTQYSFDPSMAPKGKTSIVVLFPCSMAWWEKIGYNTAAYKKEKEKILAAVTTELEKMFPGIEKQIEVSDVTTPFTTRRYTGNWQGSMEGWQLTKKTAHLFLKKLPNQLSGLENFYMIGQWMKPGGGLPPSAQSGQDVIIDICKADKKKFEIKRQMVI